jgi:hypothetical protein
MHFEGKLFCFQVTNLIWSQHFVAFEATSTFKALVEGRNITFLPNLEQEKLTAAGPLTAAGRLVAAAASSIPIGQWPQSSSSDDQSHLLQAGLEKTRAFFKKPSPVFFLGFLGFLIFLGFLFFLYICPEERVSRIFSVSRILLGASRL